MKNKYLKYTLKGLAIIVGLLLILYIIAFIYVTTNKKKIILQVTEQISKKLTGNVSIKDVELSFFTDFPKVAVVLHNVLITDTMFSQHHHAFFTGEEVFANVSVINMISKRSFLNGFKINKGSVYLYTDTNGYTNKYLFNPKKDSAAENKTTTGKNELKKIVLNDVRLIDDNRQKNKLYDIVIKDLKLDLNDKDSSTFLFSAKANMLVKSLAFNLERGSFIKDKVFRGNFEVGYDKKLKQIQLDSVDIKLDDQPFNMTARFDMAGDDRKFSLRLYTQKILYSFARSLVTPKISSALSIADIDKPLDVVALLSGPLKGGDPLVAVNFKTKNAHLKTPFVDFDKASFKGFFTNEVVPGLLRKDPNSKITITDFSAEWKDLPVTSNKIEVLNLEVPLLTCDLHSSFSLAAFNDLMGSNALQLTSGTGVASIMYKGPIAKNNITNSFVNGFISFNNGTILYRPRDVELKNVNGRIVFRSSDVFVENLQCVMLNNKVVMQGRALNLLTLIDASPNKVNIDWNIFSPSLNLNAFTYLLKARKKAVAAGNSKGKLVKMASKLDQALDQGSVVVSLKTGHMIYKKFDATNVLANISMLQDRYVINNVSMEHAGGKMMLSGSLIGQAANRHNAKIKVSVQNADISKTLDAFNNFGQDGITSKVINGKLTANIDASLAIDGEGKAYPGSVEGLVDFSLKDGALINYEPLKKMQSFVFKNRDFNNIRFAELKDRLEIKNNEVKINRMEIQSSVMSMFVEGLYSTKGNTDISIQVPFNNLYKPDADLKPENIGTDKKGGRSVYLRGRPGPDGKIKFKLDLFNKFNKEKEKEPK